MKQEIEELPLENALANNAIHIVSLERSTANGVKLEKEYCYRSECVKWKIAVRQLKAASNYF